MHNLIRQIIVIFCTGNATSLRHAKPVYVWTQTEVCKWLRRHIPPSQAKVTDIFAEHDITGKNKYRMFVFMFVIKNLCMFVNI